MSEEMTTTTNAGEILQYIDITLGNEQYGIDIRFVDNIVRIQQITRVPKSQPYYVGVINLRGEVVPIMSLRKKFELEDDTYDNATRIIIVRLEDQSKIGVIVDEVKEVVNIDPAEIEKPACKLDEKNAAYLAGIGKKGDQLISLLDIQAVLDDKKEA